MSTNGKSTKNNIEALLRHLEEGSLAYDIISLMNGHPSDKWGEALKSFYKERLAAEIKRVRDAAN